MKCKKRGRPLTGREKKQRYQVTMHHKIADRLREIGDGNLSQGIAVIVKFYDRAMEVAKYVPYSRNSSIWAECPNCHAQYIGGHTCGDRFTAANGHDRLPRKAQ